MVRRRVARRRKNDASRKKIRMTEELEVTNEFGPGRKGFWKEEAKGGPEEGGNRDAKRTKGRSRRKKRREVGKRSQEQGPPRPPLHSDPQMRGLW